MRYTLIALLLIVSLPVLWFLSQLFGWHLPSYQWSTRVTMTVSTPQGEVSASNVLGSGATVTAGPKHLGYGYQLRGEATGLQLPAKAGDGQGKPRYLFLLLKDGFYYFLKQSFPKHLQEDHKWLDHVDDLKGKSPLLVPRDAYPMLVTFDDISKPATLKRVNPDDLASTFGQGYALKSVVLQITDEMVTTGKVEGVLGDLKALGRLRPTLIPNPPRLTTEATDPALQYLDVSSFATEIYK